MSTRAHSRRGAVGTVIVMVAAAVALLVPAPAAHADDFSDWLNRVNGLRASVGAGPLRVDSEQTGLAQARAETNAANDKLAHTPNLSAGVTENWANLGENVGAGSQADLIWNAFLNSPPHYQNLTNPAFTHIGIGVAFHGSTQYVVHRFMALKGGSPVPAAPPAPAATPAPAPVPAAQPAPDPVPVPEIVAAPPTTRPRPVMTQAPRPVVTQAPRPVVTAPPVVITAPPTTEPPAPPPVVPSTAKADRVTLMLEALYRVDR